MPNIVRILMEYPLNSITVKVPRSATGAIRGDKRTAYLVQKQQHNQEDEDHRFHKCLTTFMIESFTNGAVSKGTVNAIPSGNT
jgi:hypothetical protein